MLQGWHREEYLILFDEHTESPNLADRYGLLTVLPHFTLIGLLAWDRFVVRDSSGVLFTIPTLPLDRDFLRPLPFQIDPYILRHDEHHIDRIKWHLQPIVLGGNPRSEENVTWLTFDRHIEMIRHWNVRYCELKPPDPRIAKSARNNALFNYVLLASGIGITSFLWLLLSPHVSSLDDFNYDQLNHYINDDGASAIISLLVYGFVALLIVAGNIVFPIVIGLRTGLCSWLGLIGLIAHLLASAFCIMAIVFL